MVAETIEIDAETSVPLSEVRFETSRSSGPGGQHVNKTETRVTLVFDLDGAQSLSVDQVACLRRRLASRLTKQGELRVASQSHRSQKRNREDAIERFAELLRDALAPIPERRPTRPSRAAKQRRLDQKKRRAERKHRRGAVDWE